LTSRLDALVEHGVLERRVYQIRPERHDYVLTEKGRDLRRVLISLLQWGDEWSALPEPPVTLVDADTGAVIEPMYVDAASGRPLSDIRVAHRFNR
jgi:DNA-binding HxlR family transcriptional regulator